MNIVIIEDEQKAAFDLSDHLKELDSSINILIILDSIERSVEWFKENSQPDLIFMDIQLGDGSSLNIFKQVEINCPVIFCTAYDEYAIDAFKFNGIGYIVKPFNKKILKATLSKYTLLENHYSYGSKLLTLFAQTLNNRISSYKNSYLVYHKTKMIPIPINEISLFYLMDGRTYLVTNDNEFNLEKNLESIEKEVDPNLFYRVNRQCIVSYRHIKEIEHLESRRIEVIMKVFNKEVIIVGRHRASGFKNWLDNR